MQYKISKCLGGYEILFPKLLDKQKGRPFEVVSKHKTILEAKQTLIKLLRES